MNRSTLSWAALAIAAPLLTSVVTAASATAAVPGKANVPHASVSTHSSSSSKGGSVTPANLTGYMQVTSSTVTDPAGAQVSGDATCPKGTNVVGGGAVISGFDLTENINGSIPLNNRTWRAYVNNASASDGTFSVWATCVANATGYSQVIGTGIDNPAGTQVSASATCPGVKVPLGGGGLGSGSSTQVNLNTSIPQSHGWRVDVNNNSGGNDTATAYVICATAPAKYAQVSASPATTVAAGGQNFSEVKCPARTVVFGGGAFAGSSATTFNLNSSFPTTTRNWKAYVNNGSASNSTVQAYAVCGKAAV